MNDLQHEILTEDGVIVRKGDRVFNYYDLKWGVVAEDPDPTGWFDVAHEDGTKALLNGARISTYDPRER